MPDGLEGGVGGRSQLGASQWRGANRERKKEKQKLAQKVGDAKVLLPSRGAKMKDKVLVSQV